MVKLRGMGLCFAVAACLAVAACASSGSAGSGGQAAAAASLSQAQLVAKAKTEGTVDWLSGGFTGNQPLAAAFTKKYGIKVNITKISSGDLTQRVSSDMKAYGHLNADVIYTTGYSLLGSLINEKQAVVPKVPSFPAKFVDKATGIPACTVVPENILYNSKVLGGWKPTSWQSLLDPRLKGKILVVDPKDSDAWSGFWSTVMRDPGLGTSYMKKIVEMDFQPVASSLVGGQELGAGQGAVMIAGVPSLLSPSFTKGAPISSWYPTGPAPVDTGFCAATTQGPHPYAGYLFDQFLMSKVGSDIFAAGEHDSSLYGTSIPGSPELPANPVPLPTQADFATRVAAQTGDLPHIDQILGFN